ncbi:SET domain-containing protein [Conidiobolus coronatus NRRL 28638]|uniref:SET domain-containing protein n=1 Tax=Conidiobolus coronatus (strain ATCC 28846 / CBS 209.66 / NRRL 28638) TaxID=796925 RepID=A0A137NSM3_CONC2|nr:SET domain-containing protein [Conidiobolus coronatus NRRL 28638]|eukprot:KXN65765.1 SET domain-containing protein [Conidiobolus coronatus NRRL 28638]
MIRLISRTSTYNKLISTKLTKLNYSTARDKSLDNAYKFIFNQNLVQSEDIRNSLELKETEVDHRGIYTNNYIPKGTVVSQELPVSAVLSQDRLNNSNCPQCFGPVEVKKDDEKLTNDHMYCSDECAYDSMLYHQIKEYQELQTYFRGEIRQYPLLITNIIFEVLKQFQQQKQSPLYTVLPLLSFVKQDFIPELYKTDYNMIKDKLFKDDVNKQKYFDLNWYCKVMSILDINSFKIVTNDLKATGVGLYLFSSFFNHSCDANLQVEFRKVGMELSATRDILPGEQLYISYLDRDKFENQKEVKKFLAQKYGFKCNCKYCKGVEI